MVKGNILVFEQVVKMPHPVNPSEVRTLDVILDYPISDPDNYRVSLVLDPKKSIKQLVESGFANVAEGDVVKVPDLSKQTRYAKEPDISALAKATQDIEKYRKGDVAVAVVDSNGQPRIGLTIEYIQVQHSFLFGAFSPSSDNHQVWSLMKEAGINYTTVQFPWPSLEPAVGVYRLGTERTDIIRNFGFTGIGHALIFLINQWGMVPHYLMGSSFDEFRNAVYPHIYKIVDAYKKDIKIWNVFNEPMFQNILNLSSKQTIEIIKEAARAVRDADPQARILINTYHSDGGTNRPNTFNFLKEALQSKADFDIVGLEMYYNAYMTEGGQPHPRLTFAAQAELIDKYSALGKKIVITELSVPSISPGNMVGYWDQPWSQELQAEYLKTAYTLFFSKPQVEGVTWWSATESVGTFILNGALLDKQDNPKKSYYALKQLIRSWTTSGTGVTDADGQVRFRGFGGVYKMTVTDPKTGKIQKQEFKVEEQKTNSFTITLK